ncbi:hypothetical protein G6F70_001554 [Rhizopus microsporus]|uniref:Zn(2)-C6 fungal-type domain-containing protein n=1 Tax=Rhizopus azygosporus TaxID=86630 RepID=A0A367JC93_RHIAZ|nr:hypothetical protein G6F71_001823 [Rhizopus microsporus]KAG1203256.1 hypothetical protein G6F70_001554 [Rhizopus microsporus]KAG1216356.1 hypothetical protein G6F69_000118 [Rhizopus microsporus]KAG1269000.1 hypothetical protein G6F68_000635 [Rhizopus microsporus]RCH87547.1 hypothetical protein CU097_005854 [Rhizopus azygosporus]
MPYYQQQGYQTPYQNTVLNNAPILTHPNGLSPMQHAGIPDQMTAPPAAHPPKRKQVKNACTNCQKACKKCDDARPCPRCIKYGIADTCVNSVRKERKKGIKRGPYKRRQKTEDKSRKTDGSDPNAQATQYAPTAIRGAAFPLAYPSNLNQYGQPYDPYSQYAAYHKEQMMSQPYVVNPVYPPIGYPVLVATNSDQQQQHQQQQSSQQPNASPSNQQQTQQQQQPSQQQQQHPYPYMLHQQPSPQVARPLMQHNEHYPSQIYYQQQPQQQQQQQPQPQAQQQQQQQAQQQQPQHQQQQQQQQPAQTHSQPASQRNSPHLPDIKADPSQNQDGFGKQSMTTPMPSTSTSTATTSSPDSGMFAEQYYAKWRFTNS